MGYNNEVLEDTEDEIEVVKEENGIKYTRKKSNNIKLDLFGLKIAAFLRSEEGPKLVGDDE